jgi:putative DNA primase/helicase
VWVPGRLIFCAKPDVSSAPGYSVGDADVRIVNEGGGALDVSWLDVPQPERLSAYRRGTGQHVEIRIENGALTCTDYGQLTPDTEVEVRGVTKPFSSWLPEVPIDGKLRCETPFRASTSEAAFIGRHKDGTPFLYDVGTDTKYCLTDGASFAAVCHDGLLRQAQNVAPGDIASAVEIARSAEQLGPAPRDQVLRQLNVSSGVPLSSLRAEAKLRTPDQLTLAMKVLDRLGSTNLFRDEGGFWAWHASGVWARCDDRWVKEKAQSTISEAGQPVSSRLVDGVVDVLGNHIFSPNHQFNRGAADTVNCPNGELELTEGKWSLLPHRREQYRTTQIMVRYDPNATAPKFEAFLADVFHGDADASDKRQAVLEMMGYSLMTHTDHERFAVLIGAGGNGKSVLLGILEALCGRENTAGVQPANFSKSFQRAHLQGKLVNIVTELAQGAILADAELKGIVSGEPSTVEFKFKDAFTMRPFATCWFGTNHMPKTNDFSGALFRRALIIEFNRVFSANEQDPRLKTALMAELPGILNLCLNAYAVAVRVGFTQPASSAAALKAWRLEADQVANFLEEVPATRFPRRLSVAI